MKSTPMGVDITVFIPTERAVIYAAGHVATICVSTLPGDTRQPS